MRRSLTILLAVTALTLGIAAPATGQEFGDPEFGPLVLNRDEGNPGDLVIGNVDPNVVADECITDVAGVQGWFGHPWPVSAEPPAPGPVAQAWIDRGPLIGIDVPAAWPGVEIIPGLWVGGPGPPPPGIEPLNWAWFLYNGWADDPDAVVVNPQQRAASLFWELMELLGPNGLAIEPAQELLSQTFILTFADIASQTLVGDLSSFDPTTGVGQVNVPDLPPSLSVAAAACVEPVITDEAFLAAVEAGAAYVEANNVPLNATVTSCVIPPGASGDDCEEQLGAGLGAVMLPELMAPQAGPWVELFCVSCEPLPSVNDVAAFCGVLPEIQGVPDRLGTLFAGVDLDNPATYPSVDALETLVNDVRALVERGDTTVPETVRPQWLIATDDLRFLVFGLSAIEFEFQTLVDFAPDEAARLVEEGTGEGEPNPEFDAALEVLTAFFVDNCIAPGGPGGEAGPATPTAGVARFTG